MGQGIYDGFEGYRSTTVDLKREAITSWLVVLDTNVLLGLYSFQGQALKEFTEVFRALGDRLFVPHQAMEEFWRNRRRALSENQGKFREREQVESGLEAAETAFRKWHNRVVDRTSQPDSRAMRELAEARDAILAFMDRHVSESQDTTPDTPTQEDHVLANLEPLLAGRVGSPPAAEQHRALNAEGRDRIARKVPPGYMDGDKNPDRAIGDFLVWRQTMDEARRRGLSVLMVTNDAKEDWWADRGSTSMRARPELVNEMLEVAGQRLIMLRSRELVELGGALGVQVSEATLTEAGIVAMSVGDWTAELALAYVEYLAGWPDSYEVFFEAVQSGGSITRERMARVLGRDANENMRGTGKPFVTALRRVMTDYGLDSEPAIPLAAAYSSGSLMTTFEMPSELVGLFQAAISAFEESSESP